MDATSSSLKRLKLPDNDSQAHHQALSSQSQNGSTNPEEDVQSLIGVSISRSQTRLKSPIAAAAGKASIHDDSGAFWDRQDQLPQSEFDCVGPSLQANEASPAEDSTLSTSSGETPLPSPWISDPKSFEEHHIERQEHLTHDTKSSPTISPMGIFADSNLKRFLASITMPSIPKPSSTWDISMPTLSSFMGSRGNLPIDGTPRTQRRATSFMPQMPQWLSPKDESISPPSPRWNTGNTLPISRARSVNSIAGARVPRALVIPSSDHQGNDPQPPSLRRSISDQSLAIRRESSLGSSLGDDTRWENVQRMVNSRTKAITDSLQDSSIRLPSLPTVNLGALRPDFLRGRAASDTSRSPQVTNWPGLSPAALHSPVRYPYENTHTSLQPQIFGADSLQAQKYSSKVANLHFTQALESLTGDIVIMGGYRGSILRSAKAPCRQLWIPVKVGLNIRKVNLEVGLELEDEERMEETIFSSGMLSHIGPVDMGRRLLKRLRSCRNAQEGRLRIHDYGYDWRLSPHLLSRRLIRYLESLRSNTENSAGGGKGAIVIAHSLGGLITRHAVNQRPELFAGVVYAGVPQHCINILGPMRNGDEVLLSSKVLTAQVNFTFRTSFLLLPEDGRCFIDKQTKEDYPVNFLDAAEWKRHALSPCIERALPPFVAPERRGLLNSMADNLMALPLVGRKSLSIKTSTRMEDETAEGVSMPDANSQLDGTSSLHEPQSSIPLAEAEEYLARTLATTVCFKDELKFDASHAQGNRYPPLSVLYGTSVPTVYRARVSSRAAIKCKDAYEDLAFASGDGVCLAKAAMLPAGYNCTAGGKVKTERGHVGLLGDLEAVGKCLVSVIEARKRGIGLGPEARE
ncbi:MAG: hypothetical protein Q9168_005279 [Polycauliona sp. 1 TL-2023]